MIASARHRTEVTCRADRRGFVGPAALTDQSAVRAGPVARKPDARARQAHRQPTSGAGAPILVAADGWLVEEAKVATLDVR